MPCLKKKLKFEYSLIIHPEFIKNLLLIKIDANGHCSGKKLWMSKNEFAV